MTPEPTEPQWVRTPASAVQDRTLEKVILDTITLKIERPYDASRLLDDPAVRDAQARDDYMPYWAEVWPGARMLAKALGREPRAPVGGTAIELGCGLGVSGIAAALHGWHVTFTDYDLTALEFVARNAKHNGLLASMYRIEPLDWRFPSGAQYDRILAADVTYEVRNHEPLLQLVRRMLKPDGEAWITDPNRKSAEQFRAAIEPAGFTFTTEAMRVGSPGRVRVPGTIYRLRHRDSAQTPNAV